MKYTYAYTILVGVYTLSEPYKRLTQGLSQTLSNPFGSYNKWHFSEMSRHANLLIFISRFLDKQ